MKEPIFFPRYAMPASCMARKDNSTSLRVAITSDLPSLFPIPNSTLSNLLMCLRKVPLVDGTGLYERLASDPWENRLNIRNATKPRRRQWFVCVMLIQKKVPIGIVVQVVLKMSSAG